MSEVHEGIRRTLASYCVAVDQADADAGSALFTEDCVLDLSAVGPTVNGRAAVRELAAAMTPGTGLHVSANAVIDVDGDRADVVSYVVVVGGDDDPRIRLGGRYFDELRNVDGSWLFARRRLDLAFRRKA